MTKPRRQLLIIGVLALLAYGGFTLWKLTHIHGFIVALEPAGEGRAIVCMRANKEWWFAPRAWIGLYDAKQGSWVWSERLSGLPGFSSSRRGLLVHEGRALIRTEGTTRGDALLTAHALDSGKLLWQSSLKDLRRIGYLRRPRRREGQGDRRRRDSKIAALDTSTGALRWEASTDLASGNRSPRVIGDKVLVLEGVFGSMTYDLETGAAHARTGEGPCIEDGELLSVASKRDGGFRLEATRLVDGAARDVVATLTFPEGAERPRVASCGRRGGRLLLTITLSKRGPGLLEVDTKEARQLDFSPLGLEPQPGFAISTIEQENLANSFPDSDPLTGELPPFVPLFIDNGTAGSGSLAVLDLAQRKIVRQGKPTEKLRHAYAFRDPQGADAFYLATWDYGGAKRTLARFDAKTGALSAARCMDVEAVDLKPIHVSGAELWLSSGSWLSSLPLVLTSARTLEPITKSEAFHTEECLAATTAAWLP